MRAQRVLIWIAALALLGDPLLAQQSGEGLGIIEREIRSFTYKGEAQSISLVGDFNGWNERAHRMQKLGDGTWQVDAALRKGKVYEYAFLVDGKLVPDPGNSITTGDGKLSVVNIGEKAQIFVGDSDARLEAMQLSLNRLVEQIAYLSKQVEGLNSALKSEHDLVLKREAQIDLMRSDLESARMEKVAAARDLIQREAKLGEVTEKFNALRLDHQEKTALLDSQTLRVTTMQKAIDEFQTKYNNSIQETRGLREKSQEAISKTSTLEQEVVQLRTRNQAMERELKDKTTSLEILTGKRTLGGEPTTSEVIGGSPTSTRGVNGNVLAVSDKINLLFISVGGLNGVTEGMELLAYRGDEMVGRIEVKKVEKDSAEAFAKEGYDWKKIRQGDSVTDRPRGPIVEPPREGEEGDKASADPPEEAPTEPGGTGTAVVPTEKPAETPPAEEPADGRRRR